MVAVIAELFFRFRARERSPMARKIWKSIHSRKFGCHVPLRPSAPQENQCEVSRFQANRVQNVCYIYDCLQLCLSNPFSCNVNMVLEFVTVYVSMSFI